MRNSHLGLVLTAGFYALAAASPAAAQFSNRSAAAGLEWFDTSYGANFGDVDGDGDLDLYTGRHFSLPALYWNDGTGVFSSTLFPQPWVGPIDRHGALLISVDTDGDPDLFVTHGGGGGATPEDSELYRNDGGGTWLSFLGAGGMSDPPGRTRAASAADYNGDGRLDFYVAKAPDAGSTNLLFRNDQNFFLNEVEAQVGLDETFGTNGGIWGDFDDDGDPDLLVGGEEFERPTKLFRNDDAQSFVDVTATAFPAGLPIAAGADWGDFDNDGDLDLALCDGTNGLFDAAFEGDSVSFYFNSRFSENGLDGLTIPSVSDTAWARIRVRGELDASLIRLGSFEQNPASADSFPLTNAYTGQPPFAPGIDRGVYIWRAGPNGPWEIRCVTPLFNLDTFDGYIRQGSSVLSITRIDLEPSPFAAGTARIYRNDGGVFTEVSASLGLASALVNPRQVTWVDHDNDGDLDLHVVDKGTSGSPNAPDKLYRNDGVTFVDDTAFERIAGGTAGLGDGGVWGDADNDGDLDLFLQEGTGPKFFSEFGPASYYQNDGNRGPSLQITLSGRQSGATAIGAKLTAVVGGLRVCRRSDANAWHGYQDAARVHLGLNGAAEADSLIVEWPSGIVDVYTPMPAGIWTLSENEVTTGSPEIPLKGGWGLEAPFPQPFETEQHLRLVTERAVRLSVRIVDVTGRQVRTLHDRMVYDRVHTLTWNGRDDRGRPLPAGVYFLIASDGQTEIVRRSVRLR